MINIESVNYGRLRELILNTEEGIALLVNSTKSIKDLISMLRKLPEQASTNVKLIGFDVELDCYIKDGGFTVRHSWDYLSEKDCKEIDDFFFMKLTRNWTDLASEGKKVFSEEKKMLFTRCAEYDFIRFNLILIKYIEVICRIFLSDKPTRIVIIEDEPCLTKAIRPFLKRYDFKCFKLKTNKKTTIELLRSAKNWFKLFIADFLIWCIDYLVKLCLFMGGGFRDKILIDHRLYNIFSNTRLKHMLLACFFEKGIKARLAILLRGEFYIPMRSISRYSLLFKMNRPRLRPVRDDIYKYKDLDIWEVLEPYVTAAIYIIFPVILSNMALFQKFSKRKRVKLVVMRNDIKQLERTIIEAARPLNITTLVIQHGILGDMNIGASLYADVFAGWGRASTEWFRQFGYDPTRVVVTGNPKYDQLYYRVTSGNAERIRKQVCDRLRLDPKKKIISFLTNSNYLFCSASYHGNDMSYVLKSILNGMESLSDAQLIVKLHPYDDKMYQYNEIVKDLSLQNKVKLVQNFNTFDIITSSDLVIMKHSSTGLEALILNKVLLDLKTEILSRAIVPYSEKGVAIRVDRLDGIGEAIREGLENKDVIERLSAGRKNFISEYSYNIDGQASRRVEELIYKLWRNNGENMY